MVITGNITKLWELEKIYHSTMQMQPAKAYSQTPFITTLSLFKASMSLDQDSTVYFIN